MAKQTITSVVRAVLGENLDMPADEVISRAKARGVRAPDSSIRMLVYTIKSDLRKARAQAAPAPAATAARPPPSPALRRLQPRRPPSRPSRRPQPRRTWPGCSPTSRS